MPASLSQRKRRQELQEKAWSLYCGGLTQRQIANGLGVTQPRVAQLIKKQAKQIGYAGLDEEQRTAMAMTMLMESHRAVLVEAQEVRATGDKDQIRGILSLQSISAARCARVLMSQPEAVTNVAIGVSPEMAQMFAPMPADSYAAWANSAGPNELQSANPDCIDGGSKQPEGLAAPDPLPPVKPTVVVDAEPVKKAVPAVQQLRLV